jgi:hypothetical protein
LYTINIEEIKVNIKVNWNSIDSLKGKVRYLKSRIRALEKNGLGAENIVRQGPKFEAYNSIWNSDISSIYEDLELSNEKKYFVYAHLNPLFDLDLEKAKDAFAASLGMEYVPFYIGKGVNDRDKNSRRNETHRKILQSINSLNEKHIVFRVKGSLTEAEAFQAESKLIDIFGLLTNGGLLTNLDEGHHAILRKRLYRDHLKTLCTNSVGYAKVMKELYSKPIMINEKKFA